MKTVLGIVAKVVRTIGPNREAIRETPETVDLKIAWELMQMCSMKHTQEAIN